MRNREEVQSLLAYFRSDGVPVSEEAEEAIISAYSEDADHQSLAIKVLSIFGGIMASIAFLGFLFVAGLYNSPSGMIVCGLFCLIGSVAINRISDKIIIDTGSVSFYCIGFVLLAIGLMQLHLDEDSVCLLIIAAALLSLFIAQGYILSFLSVLIVTGGIFTLIVMNDRYSLIPLYVAVLALFTTFWFLKEASILAAGRIWARLYSPVRAGLAFALLGGLISLGKSGLLRIPPSYIWLSAIGIILSVVIVLFRIFDILSIRLIRDKASLLFLCLVVLLSTALSPAISGALLLILLGFLVNHKTGLALGILSFVYFVSQFYYDLGFTLLMKSVMMISTGALFLIIYLFTHKKLKADEEI